ncbi:MAG: ABC transporter permease [Treponema sp.]|nr:ABC transporter permease [Treponema sp.]
MTLKSSFLFAKSLIFPKTEKKSSARKSVAGVLICIGLSVVPLVVVLAITNGMIDGMTERIIGLSSSHIQAYVASDIPETKSADSFKLFTQELNEDPEILNAYPELTLSALTATTSFRTGAQVRAVESDIFENNSSFKKLLEFEEGDSVDFASGKNAILGSKLAQMLDVHCGDTVRIITTKTVGNQVAPKLTSFKVSGIVSSGYQELDALWIFIPIETAFKNLSLSNANYTVMLETKDAFAPDLVRIQKSLQTRYGRIANFYRWDKLHEAEFQNFSSTKVMLVFIMVLIVLVASINVSSAIVMLVMERKKEIAILKSIGATPQGITLSFLIAGASCGLGGILIGIPVGLLLSVNANEILVALENFVNFVAKGFYLLQGIPAEEIASIHLMDAAYYLQTIPINIPFGQILLIGVLTVLLSLVVSLIPSVKAGKEKPLDILRKS